MSRCADDWSFDRSNCEDLTSSLRQASDISRYIPAVSGNLTFRNYFCARCNHIDDDLEYFPVEIKTNVLPPEHYNFSEKVNFLLTNGGEFPPGGPERPKRHHKRRYCQKSIVQSCPDNTTSESCTNGPVALVSGFDRQFKNYECALCNEPNGIFACFPLVPFSNYRSTLPQKFLLNLDYSYMNQEQNSVFTLLKVHCSTGLIYNDKLQECVEYLSPTPSEKEDRIRMLAWLSPSKDFQFTEQHFKAIMKQYFQVNGSQIYNISIQTVPGIFMLDPTPDTTILYYLVSSTLILTTEQSFDVFFKVDSNSSGLNLRSFIHFEKPLSVTLNNITYTIIKTTSRPLSCIARKVYTPQEYEVFGDQSVNIKLADIIYKTCEYYGQINGNITVCQKYPASNCEKIKTGLSTSEIPTCTSENSCKGRCTNRTQWQTETKMRCSCDPDCYEVFNDCCTDYTKYCGPQEPKETLTKKYTYTCEPFGHYNGFCTISDGLWIVARCRPDWPNDTFRAKCEAPVNQLSYSNPDLDGFLPVLGQDNTTFRNMYCARCNGVEKFEFWPLGLSTTVILPENYNNTEKIRFLLVHGAAFPPSGWPWGPGANQGRRYCLTWTIEYCLMGENDPSCNIGDTALVSYGFNHFKNAKCAACKGLKKEMLTCFPDEILTICARFSPQSFSLVLDNKQVESEIQTQVLIHGDKCGKTGMIYDDILQVCRVNWLPPPEQSRQARFYVYTWLTPPPNSHNSSFTPEEFQESLSKYLNISSEQLSGIDLTTTIFAPVTNLPLFYVVSSSVALTARQNLELSSANQNSDIASSELKIRNYIYFSKVFSLHMRGLMYSVVKATSRPLARVGKTTFMPAEYTLLEQGRIFVSTINKTYERFEYYRESIEQLETKRSNITVCQSHVLVKCNGSIALYEKNEYAVFDNLSIYVNEISSLYDYGEYEILPNTSVAVCKVPKVRIIAKVRQTIRENEALGYITFISFLLSILFLMFLLVTYTLFSQLRTLPGKNLMNFAATLLFFMIFWLPSNFTEVRADKPSCKAMAALEHYFLIASFVGMSVIAFHTCKVFARKLPAPKMSVGHEQKLFCMYLASVWILPGVFVAICLVLDDQDVVKLGYGESEICWLTDKNAYTYFVAIPVAVMLLFNIIAFIVTAVAISSKTRSKHSSEASEWPPTVEPVNIRKAFHSDGIHMVIWPSCSRHYNHNSILVFLRHFYLVARRIRCISVCRK